MAVRAQGQITRVVPDNQYHCPLSGLKVAEYYKHEIAKWNVATDDLTLEQEAAYHRVVSTIRLYERPFKNNLRVLCGLWRCNERRAKRLLSELLDAGKLTIQNGLIIDEKAVEDASTLRQSRVDKASAGRLGGIESGKSRAKPLENNNTGEAHASTREEKAREEKSIYGGDGSARGAEQTFREQILSACNVDPISGMTGHGGRQIGTQGDMAEAGRWLELPGISEAVAVTEITRIMAIKRDGPPKSFGYFTEAMRRLSGDLSAPKLTPTEGYHQNGDAGGETQQERLLRIMRSAGITTNAEGMQ